MKVYKYKRESFLDDVKSFLKTVDTLVDVGCGISPQRFIVPKVHVCIEPFKEYIEIIRGYCPSDANFIFMNVDGLTALKSFANQSVDTVCLIDVIEHVEKEEGYKLLGEANRVARQQVIVFTPLGFMPQHYEKGDKDAWGLNGVEYQQHKSGWLPEDFGKGWEFHICDTFHIKEEMHIEIDKDYGCFFAIRNKEFSFFNDGGNTPEFVAYNAATTRKIKSFPIVSVVVVGNNEGNVNNAIESILAQSYKNIEIIVVVQDSLEKLVKIKSLYGKDVKYLNCLGKRMPESLNIAIESSEGYYLSFLFHGVSYYEDKILKQISAIQDGNIPGNCIVISNYIGKPTFNNMSSDYKVDGKSTSHGEEKDYFLKLFLSLSLQPSSLLISKGALLKAGFFDENYNRLYWYDLFLKMLKNGCEIVYVDDPLLEVKEVYNNSQINGDEEVELELSKIANSAIAIFVKDIVNSSVDDYAFYINSLSKYLDANIIKKIKKMRIKFLIKKGLFNMWKRNLVIHKPTTSSGGPG